MQCLIVLFVLLELCIVINGEINSEYKNLYCVDPHTGIYYPVHSTWPSSTFCGTYTCNIRAASHIEGKSRKNKETYMKENRDENADLTEDEPVDTNEDDTETLNNGFTYVNLSNPDETIQLYNAAKNVLYVLENKVNLKTKPKKYTKKYRMNAFKDSRKNYVKHDNENNLINLSTKQLELLFDAANGLKVQLEEKLNDDQLSQSNVKDLENLLEVSYKISDMTGKEIIDKNNNEKQTETDHIADMKLKEYMNEYDEYMQEYKRVYENFMMQNNNSETCNVIKNIVSKAEENNVNPCEINQLFYYLDTSGALKQVAVPKNIDNIKIPGTFSDSDTNFNYYNLNTNSSSNDDKIEKIVLKDIENYEKVLKKVFKRQAIDQPAAKSLDYYFYGLLTPHVQQNYNCLPHHHNSYQYSYSQGEKCQNTNYNTNALNIDPIIIMDDKLLMEKFEKAITAYTEFYNYYNRKFYNSIPVECPITQLPSNFGIETSTNPPTSLTEPSSLSEYFIESVIQKNEPYQESTITVFNISPKPSLTNTEPQNSIDKRMETKTNSKSDFNETESKGQFDEIYKKLSYYTFDPVSRTYVMKTPKDNEEYEKFLEEYSQVMNLTRNGDNIKNKKEQLTDNDSFAEGTHIYDKFEFLRINKRLPTIREKILLEEAKKMSNSKKDENNIFHKLSSSVEVINKPVIREKDGILKLNGFDDNLGSLDNIYQPTTPIIELLETGQNYDDKLKNDQTSTEITKLSTENPVKKIESMLSYHNYDPILNKYVVQTPKSQEEYEKCLKEYEEVMKTKKTVVNKDDIAEEFKNHQNEKNETTTSVYEEVKIIQSEDAINRKVKIITVTPNHTTEKPKQLHPTLSYYNFDPISQKYEVKTPANNEEYEKYLKEYREIMKIYTTVVYDDKSYIKEHEEKKLTVSSNNSTEKPSQKHISLSYYNFDPISEQYVVKTPKTQEEYEKYLKEYQDNAKNYNKPSETVYDVLSNPKDYKQNNSHDGNEKAYIVHTEESKNQITTEAPKYTTENLVNVPSFVSYYNIDPISGEYVVQTPRNDEEYEKFMSEYQEAVKYFESLLLKENPQEKVDTLSGSSNIKERIMSVKDNYKYKLPKKFQNDDFQNFKDNFERLVRLKYNPVSTHSVEYPVVEEDDIVLNTKNEPYSKVSKSTVSYEDDGTFDFPSLGRRMRRFLRPEESKRSKRWEAFITVKGCPESLVPGYFKNGDTDKFYPECCPQIIT